MENDLPLIEICEHLNIDTDDAGLATAKNWIRNHTIEEVFVVLFERAPSLTRPVLAVIEFKNDGRK